MIFASREKDSDVCLEHARAKERTNDATFLCFIIVNSKKAFMLLLDLQRSILLSAKCDKVGKPRMPKRHNKVGLFIASTIIEST